jgi:hypothetical protein
MISSDLHSIHHPIKCHNESLSKGWILAKYIVINFTNRYLAMILTPGGHDGRRKILIWEEERDDN